MADDTDGPDDERDVTSEVPADSTQDPPSYRSGRVRIIGAEPAGNAVHEVTGPVVEANPDMPHWNDAPTGQVPAVLDRGNGDEQGLAPPSWREEDTDWAAHEELFEPSMLSDELPPVGSMVNDNNDLIDTERQPWRFDPDDLPDDDTLVIEGDRPLEPAPVLRRPAAPYSPPAVTTSVPVVTPKSPAPAPTTSVTRRKRRSHRLRSRPAVGRPTPRLAAAGPALSPVPAARVRAPRTSRLSEEAPNGNTGGTSGRNMPLAWGSGIVLGVVALLCAHFGSVSSMVIISVVVLFARRRRVRRLPHRQVPPGHAARTGGDRFADDRDVQQGRRRPAAGPGHAGRRLLLLVPGPVEPAADPVAGLSSTIFVVAWIGGFGSFGALLLNPTLFPHRHGVAFLLAAVITTVAADVASLLVGSAFGRHPMAPSISPNKSWEGFFGGAVAAVLVAVIVVHFIHPWTIGKALVLGHRGRRGGAAG